MNILFLMAGEDRITNKDNNYPLCLTEFGNKPLIQILVEKVKDIPNSKLIFALKDDDNKKFHLSNIISLINNNAQFVYTNNTKGSACTALMSISHINDNKPLLILNSDELIDVDYKEVINIFIKQDLEAGAIVFNSIHPRYSFLRIDHQTKLVTEASEKKPISNYATAGFYFFKRGSDFVRASQSMIRKGASVEGNYYICPSFNELILEQAKIGVYEIEPGQYIPLKSDANITKYQNRLG